MTREQLKALLPEGADDSAAAKILDALNAEIQPYREAAKQAEDDLKAANERAGAAEFDAKLDGKLRERGARSLKAARALMDLDALRASGNQEADMDAAIEALARDADAAFLFEARPVGKANIGAGTGGSGAPLTRADIIQMKDPAQRQAAIAKNMHLFQKG